MATTSKVKVQTDKLLEAVKARRASMEADHKRAVARFEKDQGTYQARVVDALKRATANAEAGKLPEHDERYRGSRLEVPVRFAQPTKPSLNTSQIDRLISTLEMAADETLTISADDAARYLG